MRCFLVLLCFGVSLPAAGSGLFAQDSLPKPDSAPVLAPPSPPPAPSPAQARYLQGLRTASRGVAQLKDGIDRVVRNRTTSDTTRLRQAGSRLAGLCGAARGFLANGRAQMTATAYEDSIRLKARSLAVQVDSLIRYMPTCEARAARAPERTATELVDRIRAYEGSLRDFRTAIALPSQPPRPMR